MAVLTASMAALPRCRASDKVSICLSTGASTMPSWVRSLRYIRRNAAWMLSSPIRPLGQSAAFLSCLRHTQVTYPAFEIRRTNVLPQSPQVIFFERGVRSRCRSIRCPLRCRSAWAFSNISFEMIAGWLCST